MLHGIHHVPVRHLHRPLHWRPLPAAVPHDRHRAAGAARHAGHLGPLHRHLHRPTAGLEAATITGTTDQKQTFCPRTDWRHVAIPSNCAKLCPLCRTTQFASSPRNLSTPSSHRSGPFTSPWSSSWPCTSAFTSWPNAPPRTWRPA